jgi:hypothetical protein
MEDTGIFGLNPSTMAIVLMVVAFGIWVAYTWYYGGATVPLPSYAIGFRNEGFKVPEFEKEEEFRDRKAGGVEGFGGVANGAGSPSCLRSSSEGAKLVNMFKDKNPLFEEGPDALRELTVLVGKLSCFKKDLVSPSYIVNATRMQPYSTSHDIEPIAETTARCFAKTISPRDLGLSLDKWNSRGELLVKKLCTSYSLKSDEVSEAQALFRSLVRDVSDIARSSCLAGEPSIAGKPGPRDAHPYEKETDFGTYTGYY